ncbi:hypothetical protein [Shewanella sp.]|uniref:hypothetical protein n=1 Tax=Shewanella sp. TaxID=50422 RepID=UPI001B4D411A|nr:hypothetical protein [Shewanella sp.]MBP6517919.1 VRR-NUC domain-containing protein [Shewanella sp.]
MEILTTTNRAGLTIYKPATKQVDRTEDLEQIDLNNYCAKLWPIEYESMWHTVNESGGVKKDDWRKLRQQETFKRMGRKKGVSDWIVMIPSGEYHGLFVELKRCHTGSITKEQKEFAIRQSALGYRVVFARGFRAALKAIEDYLNLS